MVYDVKIAGYPDLLRIDDPSDITKTRWEEYLKSKVDGVVSISGWTGRLSDVRAFRRVAPSVANKPDSSMADYLEDRRKILALTPEERAKRMGFFRLMYWIYTGKNSEEVKIKNQPIEKIVERFQLKYFQVNPRRTVCDPRMYKAFIKSNKAHTFGFSTMEQIVRQDQFAARNL